MNKTIRKKVLPMLVVCMMINIVCLVKCNYLSGMFLYNDAYNSQTKWMATQSVYVWNNGNCDVIIGDICEGKTVYLENTNPYKNLIGLFADKVEVIEFIPQEKHQEQYINAGRIASAMRMEWLFAESVKAGVQEAIEKGSTSQCYISDENIMKQEEIVVEYDSDYNLYIFPVGEYEELCKN